MKTICFELSGKTAHFKRPDVNTFTYFTYNHIPKMALLGLLGAIAGLGGYNEQGKAPYPEFYEKLKSLDVAIIPKGDRQGIFSKKIQVFNNSVGYASQEQGNNLIVREQWLEEVRWKVYVSLESSVEAQVLENLTEKLLKGESVYTPYLGKNDHHVTLDHVFMAEVERLENPDYINSLYHYDSIQLDDDTVDYTNPYTFKDEMPVGINEHGMYLFQKLGLSNRKILETKKELYGFGNDVMYFM